jgi:hypothetical protein
MSFSDDAVADFSFYRNAALSTLEGRIQSFHAVVKPMGNASCIKSCAYNNLLVCQGFNFESSSDVLSIMMRCQSHCFRSIGQSQSSTDVSAVSNLHQWWQAFTNSMGWPT